MNLLIGSEVKILDKYHETFLPKNRYSTLRDPNIYIWLLYFRHSKSLILPESLPILKQTPKFVDIYLIVHRLCPLKKSPSVVKLQNWPG